MTVMVTGGAGFIGSNFVIDWLRSTDEPIVNVDSLTYAGNITNLQALKGDSRHMFVRGNICDGPLIKSLLARYSPRAVLHFAAESHVDRSILGPAAFMQTNIIGTFTLLEEVRAWWQSLPANEKDAFRFLHVSTDEVYGSLGPEDPPFCESTAYAPNSPYSASKAASDHLVRSYHHTYGLPTLTTNCSNNYGPYQFPEKLIPLMVLNALRSKPLPVYGDGRNVRDWLYVGDHCSAIRTVLMKGRPGEVYNIGGSSERANIEVVEAICSILDRLKPRDHGQKYSGLIHYVTDRPGHDKRYAIDARKIAGETGWKPAESFDSGMAKTVRWYLDNPQWIAGIESGGYQQWVDLNYGARDQ